MLQQCAKQPIFYFALLLAVLLVFSVLSSSRIQQSVSWEELSLLPITADVFNAGLQKTLISEKKVPYSWLFVHPPLYMYSILCAFALFGVHELSARFVGIFCGILTILLVFFATYVFVSGERLRRTRIASLVSLSYALAPTTIQAAALLQIDTTILIPIILGIGICVAQYLRTKKFIWLVSLGISIALSFWARFSTPAVIITLITLYCLISNLAVSTKFKVIITLICGIVVFLVSWFLYCKALGISWLAAFVYTSNVVGNTAIHANVLQSVQNILYLGLWLGPITLLTIVIILIRGVGLFLQTKRRPDAASMFLLCSLAVIIGYSITMGSHHGYPRYYHPIFPFIYIGTGLMLSRERGLFPEAPKLTIIFLLVFLMQLIIVKDPLYIIRFTLREAAVFAPEEAAVIVKNLVLRFSLFTLLCTSLLYFIRPLSINTLIGFLVVCSVSSSIGITFSQSLAPYHTGFSYGEQGIQEVVCQIRPLADRGYIIVAPNEVINKLGLSWKKWVPHFTWEDKEAIRSYVKDSRVGAFVYSLTSNSVRQVRAIAQDALLTEILEKEFEYRHIGTFHVWLRRKD